MKNIKIKKNRLAPVHESDENGPTLYVCRAQYVQKFHRDFVCFFICYTKRARKLLRISKKLRIAKNQLVRWFLFPFVT